MADEDRAPTEHLTPDERDPEAPAADAVEQATVVAPDGDDDVRAGAEVSEYDAVEQARTVAIDDDYR